LQRYSEKLEELVAGRTAQLRRSEERHRALLEINNAIVANLDRQALFTAIVHALRGVLPFDRASLVLRDRKRDVLQVHALAGATPPDQAWPVGTEFPLRDSHLSPVFDHKRPLVRRDLASEPRIGAEEALFQEGIRSYVAVPLLAKDEPLGTLNLGSRAPDRYSEADAAFLVDVGRQVALAIDNMLAYEEIARLKARLEQENLYLQEEIKTERGFEEIVGQSPAIRRVLRAVEQVAPTDATVLLLGETGTGKEVVARAVHNLSARRDRALVKVNCAALPAGLIESELFGHEKGAFTGALSRKPGRFELADRGTLFLDEIGDLPPELQAKLLRVLQEGQFERVGGSQTLEVDVRVIAATNRDLEKAMQEGGFRPDLYYRLSVFPIRIPPLRERRGDVPLLIRYFVDKHGRKLGKRIETIPQASMDTLTAYPWPGNVRELENVIERAVILSPGPRLDLGDWRPTPGVALDARSPLTLEALERDHILAVLELTGWQVSGEKGAAKLLGLRPTTLEARMKKLGIRRRPGTPNMP
ncbi:MAG: sigma 54-interacting transcriptional regulator, partial [Candidatus Rokubacteria bacterium]|nr:sigma 54-interacting transcriptional regulator [Candidatus Rokubacteria bacterium]